MKEQSVSSRRTMLEWGLKKLEGQRIVLPKHKEDYPDRDRLAKRFEEFGRAG